MKFFLMCHFVKRLELTELTWKVEYIVNTHKSQTQMLVGQFSLSSNMLNFQENLCFHICGMNLLFHKGYICLSTVHKKIKGVLRS
jgi:hypothetical protein